MSTTATRKRPQSRSGSLAAMSAVEIKVTIRPDQELRALRTLELNEDTAEIRVIYFYDTTKLDLFNSGVVLRARLVKGDFDDSTVKFRPVDPAKISKEWKATKGFKLEADCVGTRIVRSASLTVLQQRDEIDQVAKKKRAIDKLFSPDQERFLSDFYKGPINFKKLHVLGPIRVLRWKLRHEGFAYEMTIEEWRLPDGDELVEVSIKVPPAKEKIGHKAFDKHLRKLGLDPNGAQQTKTRTALEYFARTKRRSTA